MTKTPIVRVAQGQLQGKEVTSPAGRTLYTFQGVTYAKPPLGPLRFKAPQPPESWQGIRQATAEGNIACQQDAVTKSFIGNEDCLYLNICSTTLDPSAKLPVMIWIHGGGYIWGSGSSDLYGPDYLSEKDVVVVTVNYRLGAFGFLALDTQEVPGNAGIKDMIQALRWLKQNVANFGGNPDNFTIFGESAGAGAVSLLTASPLAKPLIHQVIIMSGSALFGWLTQISNVDNAKTLAKELGCNSEDKDEILAFLRNVSSKDLVEATGRLAIVEDALSKQLHFAMTVAIEKTFPGVEAVITEPFVDLLSTGRVAQIPTMIGSTTLEFAIPRKDDNLQIHVPHDFKIERDSPESLEIAEELKRLYSKDGKMTDWEHHQLLSDRHFNVDQHRYVQYLVKTTNIPVYLYKFDYVGELNLTKKFNAFNRVEAPMHMDELGYLFKNDFQKEVEPSPQDLKVRERMVRLWTNFAKTGNPTPERTEFKFVTWQPVTKEKEYYLHIGRELSLGANYDHEKFAYWDSLFAKYYKK